MFRFGTGIVVLALLLVSSQSMAAPRGGGGAGLFSGGSVHFGLIAGISQSSQEHINTLISRANTRTTSGPISTSSLNNAYEGGLQFGFRFSGSITEMLLRPTYFYQKASGSGLDGGYNYGVTGFTIFPMVRFYPLENDIMKFFMQVGLGYGRAQSTFEEGLSKAEATGDAFGTSVGLGAEFCLTAIQCISVEGNYRYITMERNIASSASGTFASGSLSQAIQNKEIEFDGDDLAIRMGGIQLLLGYILRF